MAVNSNDYVTIQGWMISELGLKGVRLITYAIIYSFSRDGESEYYGSQRYIADFVGADEATISRALKQLVDDGLISKRQIEDKAGSHSAYRVNLILNQATLIKSQDDLTKNQLQHDEVDKKSSSLCQKVKMNLIKNQGDLDKKSSPCSNYIESNNYKDNTDDNIYNNINNYIYLSQVSKDTKDISIGAREGECENNENLTSETGEPYILGTAELLPIFTAELPKNGLGEKMAIVRHTFRQKHTEDYYRQLFAKAARNSSVTAEPEKYTLEWILANQDKIMKGDNLCL